MVYRQRVSSCIAYINVFEIMYSTLTTQSKARPAGGRGASGGGGEERTRIRPSRVFRYNTEFVARAFFPLPVKRTAEFGCDIFSARNPKAVSRLEIFMPRANLEIYERLGFSIEHLYIQVCGVLIQVEFALLRRSLI